MPYKDKEIVQDTHKYYKNNRGKILQNKKRYYQKNKEKILKRTRLYSKKWYQKNKKKIQLLHREYYRKNKEKVSQYHKKWYLENREKILQQSRKYFQKNKERTQQRHKKYNQKNKERLLQWKRVWQKHRRKINPRYRLDENMGSAIARSLKGKKVGRKWETLVGYTLEDLMEHLEKRFNSKMSWGNYGNYWTVDHIQPKSLFNYTFPNDLEFKQCWALENLQPLEKIKNIKKRNNCK